MEPEQESLSTLEQHFKTAAREYVEKVDTLQQLIIRKRKEQQPYKQDLIALVKADNILKSLEQLINDPPENEKQQILLYFSVKSILLQKQKELLDEMGKKLGVQFQEKEVTEKELQNKEKDLFEPQTGGNQSDWTDNSSVADNEDILQGVDVLAVQDNIAEAMEKSFEQDNKNQKENSQESQERMQDLQKEFVVQGKSDHLKLLKGHSKFVVSLAIDSANNKLASGSGDDTLNLYNLESIQTQQMLEISPIKTIKQDSTINILKFNFNNEILIAVTENSINLYNSIKQTKKTIELSQECVSLAVHPQGNLCVASSGYEIALYNLNNGEIYNSYYSDRQSTVVEFAPGGKSVVAGSKGQLKIIHPKTDEIKKIEHGTQFHTEEIVCLSFKQNLVLSGGVEGLVCLSNWETATPLMKTQTHPQSVESVLFSHNFIISGCVDGGIRQFDSKSFKLIQSLKYDSAVTSLISLSGSELALSTFNGTISVFDPRAPKTQLKFSAGSTIHVLQGYRDYGLFAGCQDGLIKYFDIRKFRNQ